jgi:hypothetical protein
LSVLVNGSNTKVGKRLVSGVLVWLLLFLNIHPAWSRSRAAQEDDIRETVFRYFIQRDRKQLTNKAPDASGPHRWGGPYNLIFLSVERKDPSDAFVRRLDDAPVPVRKVSQSYFKQGGASPGITDKEYDLPGILYWVDKIRWRGKDRVELRAGDYVVGRNGGASTFTLVRKNGKWQVVRITESVRA